jgi:hypothetical protein
LIASDDRCALDADRVDSQKLFLGNRTLPWSAMLTPEVSRVLPGPARRIDFREAIKFDYA